jgi:hypothetical protein
MKIIFAVFLDLSFYFPILLIRGNETRTAVLEYTTVLVLELSI